MIKKERETKKNIKIFNDYEFTCKDFEQKPKKSVIYSVLKWILLINKFLCTKNAYVYFVA